MSFPYIPSSFDHGGNNDIDTTAEQLTTSSFPCKIGILIKADDDNTGSVYVGKSDVTAGGTDATDGLRLKPGDAVFLPVANANLLYVIGSAVNQKAWFFTA